MSLSPQMHIVHIKKTYSSVQEAIKDSTGIAVLGFLYQVCFIVNKTKQNN